MNGTQGLKRPLPGKASKQLTHEHEATRDDHTCNEPAKYDMPKSQHKDRGERKKGRQHKIEQLTTRMFQKL